MTASRRTPSSGRASFGVREGGWRLYVCCATPESKHWWIEAIDADDPAGLPDGERTVVFPGSAALAVKDPIVEVGGAGAWRAWICCHPLTEPGEEDRMTTAYATSADGLSWDWHGDVLRPTPGTWDQRAARMTTVLTREPLVALYDGRASAAENWFERTGIARERDGRLAADPGGPAAASPYSDGGLRYASAVPLPGGRHPLLLRGGATRRGARPLDERRAQRIVLPRALATSSTASCAVAFSRSRIGFTSTISSDPARPDSATSSSARCASR